MLKVYRVFVQQLLAILTAIKHQQPAYGFRTDRDAINGNSLEFFEANRRNNALQPVLQQMAAFAGAGAFTREQPDLDEMISKLTQTLEHADYQNNGAAEKDLIDTIVEVLGLPYLSNRLGPRTLKRLRDAVLTPEEMQKFKQAAEARELSCATCGRKLAHNEIVSVLALDGHQNGVVCVRCHTPEYRPCPKCENGKVLLGQGFQKALHKTDICDDCKAASQPRPAAQDAGDTLTPAEALRQLQERIMNAANQQAQTRTQAAPANPFRVRATGGVRGFATAPPPPQPATVNWGIAPPRDDEDPW